MKWLILLFAPLMLHGQQKCEGIVTDKATGNKIPYATIGLVQENRGVSANERGAFVIYSSFPKTDSIRITSVGYQAQVLAVSGWIDGKPIALLQTPGLLKGIVISNQARKSLTLNRFGHCSSNFYSIGRETIYQLAQLFEASEQGLQLTQLELCKDRSESVFRFRVYDVDSVSGRPSKDLVDSVIEVRSNEKHVQVNVEPYGIIIPGKTFFVAIEWLFISGNETLEERKIQGKKTSIVFYRPMIRWVDNKNKKRVTVWQLQFNGGWKEMIQSWQSDDFQITATLK